MTSEEHGIPPNKYNPHAWIINNPEIGEGTSATLTLQLYSGEEPVGDPIDATSNVPDSGNFFRFTEGHYIYNLSTDNLQSGNWLATVALDDSTIHSIFIGIK